MKKNRNGFAGILAAEAFVLAAAALVCYLVFHMENELLILAVPFQAAGDMLRRLSLSSGSGNVAAVLLFGILGGWPLIFFAK